MDPASDGERKMSRDFERFPGLAVASAAVWLGTYTSVVAAHWTYRAALGTIDKLPPLVRLMLAMGYWWPGAFFVASIVFVVLPGNSKLSGANLTRVYSWLAVALLICVAIHQLVMWFPATQFGTLSKK